MTGPIPEGLGATDNSNGPGGGGIDARSVADRYAPSSLEAYRKFNNQKVVFLYDQLTRLKKIVYDVVPILIQAEVPGVGGDGGKRAHRIMGYEIGNRTVQAFTKAFPQKTIPRVAQGSGPGDVAPVKCVALIGSLGSVAQNNKSDFDYWVCVDGREMDEADLTLFRSKLAAIENWAAKYAKAEVHFFVMDLARIRRNDFGSTGRESSGSALGNLLKEEFYRSMTLVAGQIPLWWAMPAGINDGDYVSVAGEIDVSPRMKSGSVVDMGNLQPLSLGEFYGAAVWHISKTIGSPFKSVLKIALLEEYIVKRGAPLLADDLKRRMISGRTGRSLDPYVLMLDRATTFLGNEGRRLDLNLLRQCFYLKVGERVDARDYYRSDLPRRRQIMAELVKDWGWKENDLSRLNNHHLWSYEDSQRFSEQINSYIFRTFDRIKDVIAASGEAVDRFISPRDNKLLDRRLFAFYSQRPYKVESIKNVIESPPVLSVLTIQREYGPDGRKAWSLYRGLLSREKAESAGDRFRLMRTEHLAEALIWLVNNRLWGHETTINVNPGRSDLEIHCTAADIQRLLAEMKRFFPPFTYREITEDDLLKDPKIIRMMLVVNLNQPDRSDDVGSLSMCYQNNWGETFYRYFNDYLEALKIGRTFLSQRFDEYDEGEPDDFKIYLSGRHVRRPIFQTLSKYLGLTFGL